jgi:hypothetical protein
VTPDQEDDTRRPRDFDVSVAHPARVNNEQVSTRQTHRTQAEISRFFERLELVPPGVAPLNEWRPAQADSGPPTPAYCGIGRKIMQE